MQACGFQNYSPKWHGRMGTAERLKAPAPEMDNWRVVEGVHNEKCSKNIPALLTYSMVSEDEDLKERLVSTNFINGQCQMFDTATTICYSRNPQPEMITRM